MATESVFPSGHFCDRDEALGELATHQDSLRCDWMLHLNGACQRLIGRTLHADPTEFDHAFADFAVDIPAPSSAIEHAVLRDRSMVCAIRAGHQFHRDFHTRLCSEECGSSPVERCTALWFESTHDVRDLVAAWPEAFLRAFERDHEWPVAMRAVSVLHDRVNRAVTLESMARELGCARTALTKNFVDMFGITIAAYQRRVRVRKAVVALREENSKVSAVAAELGYHSRKNFYRALREATGLTPTALRALAGSDVQRLIDTRLAEPSTILYPQRRNSGVRPHQV